MLLIHLAHRIGRGRGQRIQEHAAAAMLWLALMKVENCRSS
jgi:hypothetical protein